MAEPYSVLASLNRMLEAEERRDERKLQQSLALMQFAQQKKLQDMQTAGQRLELLKSANSQLMASQASDFLANTGLETIYLSTFEGAEGEERANSVSSMSELLQDKIKNGGWALSQEQADKIVGAVYASKAGQHNALMDIGSEMYEYADAAMNLKNLPESSKQYKIKQQEISNMKTFGKNLAIHFVNNLNKDFNMDDLARMKQTSLNENKILEEMFEFGQGDYNIDPSISYDIEQSSDEEINEAYDELANNTSDEVFSASENKSIVSGLTLTDEVANFDKEISRLNESIQTKHAGLSNLANQISMIVSKRQSNIPLTETEEQLYDRKETTESMFQSEIQDLQNEISQVRKERKKYKKAEALDRMNTISKHILSDDPGDIIAF